jgi:hypothetical protein
MTKYTTEGSRGSHARQRYQDGGVVRLDDQPSPKARALQKSETLDKRAATSIQTIDRPNLDKNVMEPDEMTGYYLQKRSGLGQERT